MGNRTEILTETHNFWNGFIIRIKDAIVSDMCHSDFRHTEKILKSLPNIDIEGTIQYLKSNSATCECRIFPNIHVPLVMRNRTEVLTETHKFWNGFLRRLLDMLETPGSKNLHAKCNHDYQHTEKILQSLPNIDIDGTLSYFVYRRGHCDCEVFLNVYTPKEYSTRIGIINNAGAAFLLLNRCRDVEQRKDVLSKVLNKKLLMEIAEEINVPVKQSMKRRIIEDMIAGSYH